MPEHAGLWSPGRRALTIGLVLTITLVASEALAVATIMPIVADELTGQLRALRLGLLGVLPRQPRRHRRCRRAHRPARAWSARSRSGSACSSVGLVVGGLAPTMAILVAGRLLQGLGAGAIPPIAYVAIGRALPERLRPRMFATLSTAWVLPGVIGPALAGGVAETSAGGSSSSACCR